MRIVVIVITVILIVVICYLFYAKSKKQQLQAAPVNGQLPKKQSAKQLKQNDKLVEITNIDYKNLQKILTDFCGQYNKQHEQAVLRLTKITEKQFAITFPYDIEFETFCYFINYVHYPIGFDISFSATGWATTKPDDIWISQNSINKKVMIFIPTDDTDHDNVFMTTEDNIGFKLGFAIGEEKQLLKKPKKEFSSSTINISEFASKAYEEFR